MASTRLGSPFCFDKSVPDTAVNPSGWDFRTMTNTRDASGALLPDAQRLTFWYLVACFFVG